MLTIEDYPDLDTLIMVNSTQQGAGSGMGCAFKSTSDMRGVLKLGLYTAQEEAELLTGELGFVLLDEVQARHLKKWLGERYPDPQGV